jgi:hypothetical protein
MRHEALRDTGREKSFSRGHHTDGREQVVQVAALQRELARAPGGPSVDVGKLLDILFDGLRPQTGS